MTPQGKLEGCTVISMLFIMRNHTTNYLTLQSTGCRAAVQQESSLQDKGVLVHTRIRVRVWLRSTSQLSTSLISCLSKTLESQMPSLIHVVRRVTIHAGVVMLDVFIHWGICQVIRCALVGP